MSLNIARYISGAIAMSYANRRAKIAGPSLGRPSVPWAVSGPVNVDQCGPSPTNDDHE